MAVRCGLAGEDRMAHRHDNGVSEHDHPGELETMDATRRVQDDAADSPRGAQDALLVDGPWCDEREIHRTALEPGAAGLLPVQVAQGHRVALPRTPRCQMGCECAFSTAAFAVDDSNHGHQCLQLSWIQSDTELLDSK